MLLRAKEDSPNWPAHTPAFEHDGVEVALEA